MNPLAARDINDAAHLPAPVLGLGYAGTVWQSHLKKWRGKRDAESVGGVQRLLCCNKTEI